MGHEGGYSNNKNDPGGETNFGVKQTELARCYSRLKLPSEVKFLTESQAKIYYKSEWWDKYHYETINSLYIATKIFDMAVNMGAKEAHILAQRACNYCGYNEIEVDGILGTNTIASLNEISLHGREDYLRNEIIDNQEWFYQHLAENDSRLEVFLKGWINRAAWWPNVPA